MNWKRIVLCVLMSPIIIPVAIIIGSMFLILFGIEYALTGK